MANPTLSRKILEVLLKEGGIDWEIAERAVRLPWRSYMRIAPDLCGTIHLSPEVACETRGIFGEKDDAQWLQQNFHFDDLFASGDDDEVPALIAAMRERLDQIEAERSERVVVTLDLTHLSSPIELYEDDGTEGGCHYATINVDKTVTVHNQDVYDQKMISADLLREEPQQEPDDC